MQNLALTDLEWNDVKSTILSGKPLWVVNAINMNIKMKDNITAADQGCAQPRCQLKLNGNEETEKILAEHLALADLAQFWRKFKKTEPSNESLLKLLLRLNGSYYLQRLDKLDVSTVTMAQT